MGINLLAEYVGKGSSQVTIQERLKLQHNTTKDAKELTDE